MNDKYLEKIKFNDKVIESRLELVDKKLKNYIAENILFEYNLNDKGHDYNHVQYVMRRAFEMNVDEDIDYNILYVCVSFHDIACHINRDEHEMLSAKKAFEDEFLNRIFSKEQMLIIKEAIEDHRASLEYEPRNIYGKILSSADRKVEVREYLIASISYGLKKHPKMSKEENILRSYEFAIKKFGVNGYAVNKSYVDDKKYEKYLKDIQYLIDHKEIFDKLASKVYDSFFKN